jgi:hypothetical protein
LTRLVVVSKPVIWMLNLYDRTSEHIVDPGPTCFAKAPVFGTPLPGKLASLELGCESAFIAEFAPDPIRHEQIADARYDVYAVRERANSVELPTLPRTKTPSIARYFRNGELQIALRYDLYVIDLADEPQLFARPSGITYE